MCIEASSVRETLPAAVSFRKDLVDQLNFGKQIALEAGELALRLRQGNLESKQVALPNGKNFVQTRADIEAGNLIIERIKQRYPKDAFISQDHVPQEGWQNTQGAVWIINAIDNTKEFEKGGDDFHIQIGLVHNNTSVLGISYYPAKKMFIYAVEGNGAWKEVDGKVEKLNVRPCANHVILKSSSHTEIEPLLGRKYEVNSNPLSSTGRLLEMIEGKASLYVSLGALGKDKKGGTWNYGANTVIAKEAGLTLMTLKANPLNLRHPSGLLEEGVLLTSEPESTAVKQLISHFKSV